VPEAVLALAALHRLRQQALAAYLIAALRRFWSVVDPGQAQASWDRVAASQALQLVTATQAEAARGAEGYVSAAVAGWEASSDPAGTPVPGALAGVAADGRPLDGLLSYPAFQVDAFVSDGMAPSEALAIGQRPLERLVVTTVQDTARVATGVAVVNDRTVHGYVRMLTPPSCSRCVVLAGKFYATNAGFERHPQCDCVHIPAVEHLPDVSTDPKRYFDSLDRPEQDATFTRAGAQAVRDGADVAQVVNARRGMSKAASGRITTERVYGREALITREGITKRGVAGKRLGKRNRGVRLMPEQIYLEAAGSRTEAIRLLKLHGYIV
jgi:hypothetical protein